MFDLTHIHPMLVHFPIALLIVGILAEVVGLALKKKFFSDAAFLLLILGAAGAVAAVLSGSNAAEGIEEAGTLKQAVEAHEGAAELAMWLTVIAASFRTALFVMKKHKGALQYVSAVRSLIDVFNVSLMYHDLL